MKYQHIIQAVAAEPWAIDPLKGRAIVEFLAFAAAGGKYTPEERAAKIGAREAQGIRRQAGSVALIPLHGVMSQRIGMLEKISGGTSSEQVKAEINAAVADDSIKAIILHVDSPGGSVYGTRELAAAIRSAKAVKPVIAQIDSQGLSAAYWAPSQATEIVITPGGDAGSIGVYTLHQDLSRHLEEEGVTSTLVFAGENKVDGNPFEPLSDDARAHLQARVDGSYHDFVADVAKGRGIEIADVESKFGQGRALPARDALKAGMVDRIATFDETIERYARKESSNNTNRERRARANSNALRGL